MTPDPLLVRVLVASIVLSVLSIGLGARLGAARRALAQPGRLGRALAGMFIIMPAIAAVVAFLLPLDPAGRTVLLALFLAPLPPLFPRKGEPSGTLEDDMIGGQIAAAAAALIAVPAWILFFELLLDRPLPFDKVRLVITILATIGAPLVLGMLVNHWRPALAARIRRPLGRLALAVLVAASLILFVQAFASIRAAFTPLTLLAIALLIGLGLGVGWLAGAPDRASKRMAAVAMITRHPGVALVLGTSVGTVAPPLVLGAVLLYFALSFVAGLVFLRVTSARHSA
jgi:BASS family bile acid:Na+ symporter